MNISEKIELLINSRKYSEAIVFADAAIQQNKLDCELYSKRAKAHSMSGRIEEAVSDINVSIKLAPKTPGFYMRRAYYLLKLHKYEQAEKDLDFLIRFETESTNYYFTQQCYIYKAFICKSNGDTEQVANLLVHVKKDFRVFIGNIDITRDSLLAIE